MLIQYNDEAYVNTDHITFVSKDGYGDILFKVLNDNQYRPVKEEYVESFNANLGVFPPYQIQSNIV